MSDVSFSISGRRHKNIYKWEKFQPTKEWVSKNVYLNSDVSPITGYLDLKYTPHLEEIFDDYDNEQIWKQTFQASTQCAKTTAIFCLAFKDLDTDPAKAGIFIPADDGVRDYLSEKLDPFLSGIKSIKNKIEDVKEDTKKKIVSATKTVPGGSVSITGTSARQRRSKTLKRVFLDEVSLFPKASVTEIISRTKFFEKYFRKVFLSSSIRALNDEICKSYDDSDLKKEWQFCCPGCKNKFYPGSKNFKFMTKKEYKEKNNIKEDDFIHEDYRNEALKDVYTQCPHCEYKIYSKEKDSMVLNKELGFEIVSGDKETAKTIGYKANALGMFPTNYETIARLIIDAKEDIKELEIIYIEYFNEIYESELKENRVKENEILLLSNDLERWEIPKDTVKVYLTVDTQKDHFYYKITAYQYGFIANTVSHGRIETTADIKNLLYMNFIDKDGNKYKIDRCCIDRRGISERTTQVDEFIIEVLQETGEPDLIYAYEGVGSISGNQLYNIKRYKKTIDDEEYEFKVLTVSNLMAKNDLSNMINRTLLKVKDDPKAEDFERRLFYINQDIVEISKNTDSTIHSYERHMTSEAKVINDKGKEVWEKINSSVRNDYWDCSVIALALAEVDLVANLPKPIPPSKDDISVFEVF